MILTTTNENYGIQNQNVLYAPIDPKYLYQVKNNRPFDEYLPASGGTDISYIGPGLDELLGQRKEIIHSQIKLIASEIYQRYELKNDNLYKINLDQCTLKNLIYMIGDEPLDRRRIELEGKILDLEQEKRREKAGYFRDILFLKKDLRESLIENIEEEQKAIFFTSKEELP